MVYQSLYSFRCLGSHIIKANGGFSQEKHKNTYQGLFFSFSAKHKKKKNGLVFNSKYFQFF